MSEKRRPRWHDYSVYLAVRTAVCVIQALPPSAARALADLLAAVAYRVDRRHRQVADENLQHAFPELTPAKRDRRVRAAYRHFIGVVVEIVLLPRKLHVGNWRNYAALVGGDKILSALLSDRPVLFATGHFGNWEMSGYALGLFGFKTHAIARTLDNPYLERFLKKFREKTGQQILAKKGDFDNIQGVLASGGTIATLADQDAGPRGQFVDFFNRPASTHKAVALMALEFNAVMIVIGVPRVRPPMYYHIIAEDAIFPEEYAGRPDAVAAITRRYTEALERVVRRYPDQYFWLHRRWKHQPAAKKGKKAA
jgi:KDO2-lipid IV(A) lauroyltransferase